MSFVRLNDSQRACLRAAVADQHVVEFGAGDLALAQQMRSLGARHIVAVDKDFPFGSHDSAGIEIRQAYFHNADPSWWPLAKVGVLAWPSNVTMPHLLRLLEPLPVLVYIGSNIAPNACGWPGLFRHLLRRPLLHYVADPINSLVIVGRYDVDASPRRPTGEEAAALAASSEMWTYADQRRHDTIDP